MNNGEISPESVHATPEQMSRAYEEGVLLGAGLPRPAENSPIGNAPEESEAYKLGLKRGHELLAIFPDSNVRRLEAANAVEAYVQSQVKAN